MKFPVFILTLQHCKLILPRFIGWRRSRGDRPTVFAARWGHRALPMNIPHAKRAGVSRYPSRGATGGLVLRSFSEGGCPPMAVSLFYGSVPFISVLRFEIGLTNDVIHTCRLIKLKIRWHVQTADNLRNPLF